MKDLEYTTVDKSDWGAGPWQSEPDKKQWLDLATGYPCLIHRSPSGALCGYVGVAKTHPLFGQSYNDVDVRAHGGITYADSCQDNTDPSKGICHLVEDGENDDRWWFGFDCAHGGDHMPAYIADIKRVGEAGYVPSYDNLRLVNTFSGVYRDLPYVVDQVESLAKQLKTLEMV